MQQERRGGGGRMEDMEGLQQQDRRGVKPNPDHQPPQQPQKCPRCESLNTKFCYYNNYSLSQPRYFCKACRRYWTQGGTLRNVPVGGGCRKGKRSKRPSSSDNQQPPQPNLTTVATTTATTNVTSSPIPPIGAASSMYYPGGGFLSSMQAFQSFNQPINVGGDYRGSNMALLQGFSFPSLNFQQQQQQQVHQSQVFQMGNRDKAVDQILPLENVIQPNRPSISHQDWPPMASEAGYWSNNNNNTNNSSTGPSLNQIQWPDIPGFGPPPSSSSPSF